MNFKNIKIGNLFWLLIKNENGGVEQGRLLLEVKDGNQLDNILNNKNIDNFIAPIELNEDMLLSFNFSKIDHLLIYKDTALCCYWDGVEWCFKYGLDSDLCFISCQYLNELQDIISLLFKEELDCDFFKGLH